VRLAAVILALALAGCAANPPACTFGVMVFGPLPVPYIDCGVTLESTGEGRQRPGRHGKKPVEDEE
jgi:hypothetical protein